MNLLFVCSRNQWRSPTAEAIYRHEPYLSAKSAGTAATARIRLTGKLIAWADIIFAMEKKHQQVMQQQYPGETRGKQIVVLNIADEYAYMDEDLIDEIRAGVDLYLS